MRLSCGYETKKARVEMLPLIDVVFLLLVFFIYAMLSMVVHHSLKVDLPSAGTAVQNQAEHITVTIDSENRIFLNSAPIGIDELSTAILAWQEANPGPVFIDGDQAADLGIALRLLDRLKQSGIEEVSFSCKTDSP